MTVKFMYNGLKVDGQLFRGAYSKGPWTAESKLPDGTITIYAKDYKSFPAIEGLNIQNETDIMTDYFETDKIRIKPGEPYYFEALTALNKCAAK